MTSGWEELYDSSIPFCEAFGRAFERSSKNGLPELVTLACNSCVVLRLHRVEPQRFSA